MAPDVGQRFLDDASHLHTGRPGDRGRKPIFHHQLELAAFADLAIQFDDGLHGADQEPLPGTLQPQVIDGVAQASDRPLERLYLVFRLSGAVYTLRHPPENLHRLKGVREVLQDHVVQLAGYPLTFGLPDLAQGLFGPLALGNVLYSTLVTRDTSTSIIDGARAGRTPPCVPAQRRAGPGYRRCPRAAPQETRSPTSWPSRGSRSETIRRRWSGRFLRRRSRRSNGTSPRPAGARDAPQRP